MVSDPENRRRNSVRILIGQFKARGKLLLLVILLTAKAPSLK